MEVAGAIWITNTCGTVVQSGTQYVPIDDTLVAKLF